MKLTFEIISGNNTGEIKEFSSNIINIGSLETNDLVFNCDNNVSPNHAMVKVDQDKVYIYNHSSNGTYINNELIDNAILDQDSTIKLGQDGPSFKISFDIDETILPIYEDNGQNRRWYDRDALISKSMKIFEQTNNEKAISVANELIKILNKQDSNVIFVRSDINIEGEIRELPQQYRWYDLNKSIQIVVETLKVCKPETQHELVTQLIIMLDTDESKTVTETTNIHSINCPKCNQIISEQSNFCLSCGHNIKSSSNEKQNLLPLLLLAILIPAICGLLVVVLMFLFPGKKEPVNSTSNNTKTNHSTSEPTGSRIPEIPSNNSYYNNENNYTLTIARTDDYAVKHPDKCRVYLRPTYESHQLNEKELEERYEPGFIYCGSTATVINYQEPLYQIETPDGRTGWIYAGTTNNRNLPPELNPPICILNQDTPMTLPNGNYGKLAEGSRIVVISQDSAMDTYTIAHHNGTTATIDKSVCNIR